MENLCKEYVGEFEKCEKRFKVKMVEKELDYNLKIK